MKKPFAVLVILLMFGLAGGPLAQATQNDESWLNEMVGGHVSNDNVKVEFHSKVTKSQNKSNFIYWYKVENLGAVEVIIQWELIDRVMSGRFNFMYPIRLKPGEAKEFTLESDGPPVVFNGRDRVFREADAHFFELLENEKISVSKDGLMYMFMVGSTHPGFLPEKLTKKLN